MTLKTWKHALAVQLNVIYALYHKGPSAEALQLLRELDTSSVTYSTFFAMTNLSWNIDESSEPTLKARKIVACRKRHLMVKKCINAIDQIDLVDS